MFADWTSRPKIELHLHLEGAVSLGTLVQLGQKNDVRLPGHLLKGDAINFRTFDEFVDTYTAVVDALQSEADFLLPLADVIHQVREQNMQYCEVSWTPFPYMQRGLDAGRILALLNEQLALEGLRDKVFFIIDVQRDHDPETAEWVYREVVQPPDMNIAGVGLTGRELVRPSAVFQPFFDKARDLGLGLTAHAGEYGPPEVIRECVEILGVSRLGHGIRAVEDPALLEMLLERQIHFEISPTSNVLLERVADYPYHPVRQLFDLGCSVGINTDDPGIFQTTLSREYDLLARHLDFSEADIRQTLLYSAAAAFCDTGKKQQLVRGFGAGE